MNLNQLIKPVAKIFVNGVLAPIYNKHKVERIYNEARYALSRGRIVKTQYWETLKKIHYLCNDNFDPDHIDEEIIHFRLINSTRTDRFTVSVGLTERISIIHGKTKIEFRPYHLLALDCVSIKHFEMISELNNFCQTYKCLGFEEIYPYYTFILRFASEQDMVMAKLHFPNAQLFDIERYN